MRAYQIEKVNLSASTCGSSCVQGNYARNVDIYRGAKLMKHFTRIVQNMLSKL